MRFSPITLLSALAATAFAQAYNLSLVYQFNNSFSGVGFVDIENIALRTSNGQLLLTTVTNAILAQVNPAAANPQAELILDLTGAAGNGTPGSLTGIAEYQKDVFAVAAASFQFGPQVAGGAAGIPGTSSIWSVDLNGPKAEYKLVAKVPEAGSFDGVAALPWNKDVVLIADAIVGAVWSVNMKTGEYKIVIQDPIFLPTAQLQFGINGIKIAGDKLYFTSSGQFVFGAIKIDPYTGQAAGPIEVLANSPNGTSFDDFSIKPYNGSAWIASPYNSVYEVPVGGAPVLAAGGGNSTTLKSPTSTAFGADGCTLYITTGGMGGPPDTAVSGGIYSINTCPAGKGDWQQWSA